MFCLNCGAPITRPKTKFCGGRCANKVQWRATKAALAALRASRPQGGQAWRKPGASSTAPIGEGNRGEP